LRAKTDLQILPRTGLGAPQISGQDLAGKAETIA